MAVLDILSRLVSSRPVSAEITDWDALLNAARLGGVEALLHRNLPSHAPAEVSQILHERTRRGVFNGIRANQERVRILSGLKHSEVGKVVLLKGPVLGPMVYDEPLDRVSNDLDLLIGESGAFLAAQKLLELGYQEKNTFKGRPVSRAEYHERLFWRTLVDERVRFPVELHTAFAQRTRYRIPYMALIDRALPFPQGGAGAYRLTDVDQLLHLAVHLCREQFKSPLKNLLDVHLWIERGIDWPLAVARAKAWGCATALAQTLRLSERVFETHIPSELYRRLGYRGLRGRYLDWWHTPIDDRLTRHRVSMRASQLMTLAPLMDSTPQRAWFVGNYVTQRVRDRLAVHS